MALKGRYLISLNENAEGCEKIKAAAEGNEIITDLAKRRRRYGFDERWWAVGAGLMIVLLLIAYSVKLNTVAAVILTLLVIYMAFVLGLTIFKRYMLKRTPVELSPLRAENALFSRALDLETREPLAELFDRKQVSDFSSALAKKLIPLSREAGVEPENWTVKTDANVQSASEDGSLLRMPTFVTVRSSNGQNECEFIFEYEATFICLDSGDYIPADCSPEISSVIKREERLLEDMPSMVGFKKCVCGRSFSTRALKALDSVCPVCGKTI